MGTDSNEELFLEDYFDQHYCDFDFVFRCVVYDPCDRPGHFPHSDMWLNAKQQRVQDTILDWLVTIAWDWDQVAVNSVDALHRTMFINEFVTFDISPLGLADYQAANLSYTCKSSGKKCIIDTFDTDGETAYFYIKDSLDITLRVVSDLYDAGIHSSTTLTPQYFAGDDLQWFYFSRSPQPFCARIMNSLDGLQESLSNLPPFSFQMLYLFPIENDFYEIIRRGYERVFGCADHSMQVRSDTHRR